MLAFEGKIGPLRCYIRVCLLLLYACGLCAGMTCSSDVGVQEDRNAENSGPDTTPPAEVGDLLARTPATRSVTLVWTAPGDDGMDGRAQEYDVRYSTDVISEGNWDASTPVDNEPAPTRSGELQSFRVLGLDPVTEYHFALRTSDEAANVSGISNNADITTTQEVVPPSPVTNLSARAVSASEFMLTWTSTGDDGVIGQASQYDIRYRTSVITNNNWTQATRVEGEPPPGPPGELDSMVVSGLAGEEHYTFALKAADEVPNWSQISNVVPGFGIDEYLVGFPGGTDLLQTGDDLNIYYKASAGKHVYIAVGLPWMTEPCGGGSPFVIRVLADEIQPEGTYHITYDFFDETLGEYLDSGWYLVTLCWGSNQKGELRVFLRD